MSTSQIQGFTSANIMEVEANTRAARVTLRPEDFGSLGIYAVGNASGAMTAGMAAASTLFSARWTDATRLCLIKRVTFSAGVGATGFTAGAASFNLFVARSWTVADTAQTAIGPSGNQSKMRTTGMGTTLFVTTDIRIANTAGVTAGTRTLDANPISSLVAGAGAAGTQIVSPFAMVDQRPGEHPLILAQNEGIVLQGTVPATGVWQFGIKFDWTEIAAY